MELKKRLNLMWRILRYKPGNLLTHARRELGPNIDIELEELIFVFSTQGHSGASAQITTEILGKLLRYEPLSPLKGTDDEWMEVSEGLHQNIRCSHVFKDAARYGGQAYDIDAITWVEPDGSTFGGADSIRVITFPYTPKREYLPVSKRSDPDDPGNR